MNEKELKEMLDRCAKVVEPSDEMSRKNEECKQKYGRLTSEDLGKRYRLSFKGA